MSPVVIKVGGALLDAPKSMQALFENIASLMKSRSVVLVHGGGVVVEDWLNAVGLTTEKRDGLRVTPDNHMPYICGALAGFTNKTLSATAKAHDIPAVSLSLHDGGMVDCDVFDERLGAVGKATPASSTVINALLGASQLVIVSSIGASNSGQLLNVNADQAATAIAKLLNAELLLLSDVDGVKNKNGEVISHLNQQQIDHLIKDGTIRDGMVVKTHAALDAADALSRPVMVANWSATLTDVLNFTSGTQIRPTRSN